MKEQRKKVLIVASVPSMIGQFNMGNIQVLQELGYDVEIACNFLDRSVWDEERVKQFEKELQEKKIKKYQVNFSRNIRKISCHIQSYRQLKKILLEGRYEFLHCHTPIGGALGRVVGYITKVKVIYTAHGFHFYKGASIRNWFLYYPIEWSLAYDTDVLIAINKEDYENAKRFHARKVEYIPGIGIDLEKIREVKIDKSKKRKEIGILEEDAIVMVSVGELSKRKNHRVVIQVMGKIKRKNIYYIICGEGKEKEQLKKLAEKEGISDRVKLLGFRRDVIEIYKASDIFIFPSLQEGLPVALMEAMASGLPCIVSNIRGNRDLIQNNRNGLLFSVKSEKELLDGMEKIIKKQGDISYRKKLEEENKEILQKIRKEVVLEQIKRIYKSVGT